MIHFLKIDFEFKFLKLFLKIILYLMNLKTIKKKVKEELLFNFRKSENMGN